MKVTPEHFGNPEDYPCIRGLVYRFNELPPKRQKSINRTIINFQTTMNGLNGLTNKKAREALKRILLIYYQKHIDENITAEDGRIKTYMKSYFMARIKNTLA